MSEGLKQLRVNIYHYLTKEKKHDSFYFMCSKEVAKKMINELDEVLGLSDCEQEIESLFIKKVLNLGIYIPPEAKHFFELGYKEGVKRECDDFIDKQIKYSEKLLELEKDKIRLYEDIRSLNIKIEKLERDLMHAQAIADNGRDV